MVVVYPLPCYFPGQIYNVIDKDVGSVGGMRGGKHL